MVTGAQQVVVIGAGVSGLTSAVCLAEAGRPVRVWTAAPPRETTSVVAGAVWGPVFTEPVARTLAWTEESLREFRELAKHPATGVRMAPAMTVGELPAGDELPPQAKLIPDLRPADSAGLPEGFQTGYRATMPMIDMPQYLDYLTQRLAAAGCEIEAHPVRSLAEAADAAPTVVNCAGLSARELAGDDTVRPLFGQHVVLTNPGLRQLFLELNRGPEWTCYFPHPRRVVCGGISIPDRWDTTPDSEVTERILQRCRRVEPRLAEAQVIETITGLRPDRPRVRVEVEPLGPARCIHNYGHGSHGVTLSWGCAREVARLVGAG
ncbi:FAD-dependent oxidoreductase [Mycobacterium lacus]|uniref:FAD-dependent oxidoreductase n=1 Tax=Mycobacterium lacus TaxID=169765 RepID=UPI000A15696A|nr:FAD-dependent oxidoreductase [Mycobacterium lacus]MCV7122486.1 FAD-dependent oxidoreductase [Mycobacterium lacus]ORW12138.1 amino acid oxidase [Mycobacterium lacus]